MWSPSRGDPRNTQSGTKALPPGAAWRFKHLNLDSRFKRFRASFAAPAPVPPHVLSSALVFSYVASFHSCALVFRSGWARALGTPARAVMLPLELYGCESLYVALASPFSVVRWVVAVPPEGPWPPSVSSVRARALGPPRVGAHRAWVGPVHPSSVRFSTRRCEVGRPDGHFCGRPSCSFSPRPALAR